MLSATRLKAPELLSVGCLGFPLCLRAGPTHRGAPEGCGMSGAGGRGRWELSEADSAFSELVPVHLIIERV